MIEHPASTLLGNLRVRLCPYINMHIPDYFIIVASLMGSSSSIAIIIWTFWAGDILEMIRDEITVIGST